MSGPEEREGGCLPAELHGPLVERRGSWNLYRSRDPAGPYSTHLLEHVGPRVVTSESDLLALRSQVPAGIATGELASFGVGICGDNLPAPGSSAICLHAGVLADTDPFVVARRLDAQLGAQHRELCFGVAVGLHRELHAF